MTPVSGPLLTITRDFDPRHLASLELWLPHFLLPDIPGGSSLGPSDHWPGAPALGAFPGSPADGVWSGDPTGEALSVRDDTAPILGFIYFPWITGARGMLRGFDAVERWLVICDTGTTTPRTIALAGPLTFVATLRNTEGASGFCLDDGTIAAPPTTGFYLSSDRFQVYPAGVGSEVDISDDTPELDGTNDGDVLLIVATRDASDAWRCWINGVERSVGLTQAGTITIESAFSTNGPFTMEASNFLLYSADHSARAADLNQFFASQHGVP